jgi:hypothetical protein
MNCHPNQFAGQDVSRQIDAPGINYQAPVADFALITTGGATEKALVVCLMQVLLYIE